MKKLIAILMTACLMLTGAAALGDEVEVDAGRLSITVPDGWQNMPLSETQIVAYQGEELSLDGNYVSVTFYPVGDMFWDMKDYYEDVQDLDPITTGDYTWTAYNYTSLDAAYTNALCESEAGTLVVALTRMEAISLESADVQAMLGSIKVVPTITGDWFSVGEDGTLTVTLEEMDDYIWGDAGASYSTPEQEDAYPEAQMIGSSENGVYTATLTVKDGDWYTQYFSLQNDNASAGQAVVTVKIEDDKIVAVTNASLEIFPEPQTFEYNDDADMESGAIVEDIDFYFNDTTWESGDMKMAAVYQDGYYKVAIQDGDTELSYLCDTGAVSGWKIGIGTGVAELDAEQADGGLAVFHIDDEGNMVWKRATGDEVVFTWYSEAN